MERVEQHVLHAEAPDVIAFKNSFHPSFNLVAVAGANTAQVAITALSLPSLNEAHWTAWAFFEASLISGSLSVFFSCVAQQAINSLHEADEIEDWLCRPSSFDQEERFQTIRKLEEFFFFRDMRFHDGVLYATLRDAIDRVDTVNRWKIASSTSAMMLATPTQLLTLALNAFIIGVGVYLGCLYSANLIPTLTQSGSLAVLILYILVTCYGLVIFYIPSTAKGLESAVARYTRD